MKYFILIIMTLSFATASASEKSSSAWQDLVPLSGKMNLTEVKPGYYESNSDGIIIRFSVQSSELYFASCPDYERLASDTAYRSRWNEKYSSFFKHALPSWEGANLAFTQIWIALETAQQKESTIRFDDMVMKPNAMLPNCRMLTITEK